jgi:hypothetical protein
MFASSRTTCLSRPAFSVSVLTAILACSSLAPAQGTHLWTQSKLEEFEKGTPQGVSLQSDGQLREGPGLRSILTTPSTFVWSVATDKAGVAYLGTASPANVLRVGLDGKPFTLFETKDLSVQVVRLGPDGSLYAAMLPSGKVYRLKPDATTKQDDASATLVFDPAKLESTNSGDSKSTTDKPSTSAHYIWDLTFDQSGRLYIAAGGPAAIYRVDPAHPAATPETFFKSDEAHIRSLAWDAKGNLIAGSDGSGLVYRISPEGKGYVLFDAPRREITAVAVSAKGTIYAASVGDKSRNPLPPLPVQGIGTATITIIQPQSLQAVNTSTSLPDVTDIYALDEGQAPRKLWSGKDDIVYTLAARPDGLLALTGNRGHIFRIQNDGSYADIAHLEAQQGLSMAINQDKSILVGTGNTGKLYLLGAAEKHEFASNVFDAGALARFGRVEVEPGSSAYDIFTRSGNVEQPVRGWSDWEPLKEGTVASPAGRFLQWKAVLHANGTVGSVAVNYLPVNAAPVVDDLVVVAGARFNPQSFTASQPQTVNVTFGSPASPPDGTTIDSTASTPLNAAKDRTAITVRWTAHDENGDDLTYSLYLRGDGESVWRLLKDKITDKAYSFDATQILDGGYQIKVTASDAPSHTPADALAGEKISDRFEVDTTPPTVVNLKAAGAPVACEAGHCTMPFQVTFEAQDASSPIARAEYSLDAGPWQYVEPVGKISDSKTEHYSFQISLASTAGKIAEHLITVRAYDRFDNVGAAKTVILAQ